MNRFVLSIPRRIRSLALPAILIFLTGNVPSAPDSTTHDLKALSKACEGRDGWADPAPPARIFGNTWYVGTCGITVLLVTSPRGHLLIDGGPAEAAPHVAANITALGFALKDVRWIAASHEHHDHVGALAQLQRLTGAKVIALPQQAEALRAGTFLQDDPQHGLEGNFETITPALISRSGKTLKLGNLRVTGTATPTHSPGSTSWRWKSCEGSVCRTIAYADSATTISADGYRFTAHPERQADVRRGLDTISALPCELLLTPHPLASAMFERFAGAEPLAQPKSCVSYAARAKERFAARLQREAEGTEP